MKIRSRGRIGAHVALAACLATASLAVAADELQPWNQEKVTALAGELVPATQALRQALRQKPPPTMGQATRRAFWRLRDQLRSIEAAAGRLHRALGEGEGLEETFPIYRRMIVLVRDASRELQRIPSVKPVEQNVEAVAAILRQLRPFYETDPIL